MIVADARAFVVVCVCMNNGSGCMTADSVIAKNRAEKRKAAVGRVE